MPRRDLLLISLGAASLVLYASWRRRRAQRVAEQRGGVRIIARHGGLCFLHKPGGMTTHPMNRRRKRVESGKPLLCPACGRNFGVDVGSLPWLSLRNHLLFGTAKDEGHTAWRAAHPAGLEPVLEKEERTLWHVVRDWPIFHRSPSEGAIHICNRLDRGTSGIVCVAESSAIAQAVQRTWTHARKEYLVLVRGAVEETFTISRPLTDRSTKMSVAPLREAETAFRRLRTYDNGQLSLLRATLVSGGRQHQIRRHLNSVAHQVVGDHQYGRSRINRRYEAEFGLPRFFLHAERLRMRSPQHADIEIDVHDPLAADLAAFLERLPP